MVDIPTGVPSRFRIGDTVEFYLTPDEPDPVAWVVTIDLVGTKSEHNATATFADPDYLVALTPAETLLLEAGVYRYQIRKAKAGKVYTIKTGEITVDPDLKEAGAAADFLSTDEKILANINSYLEGDLRPGIGEYQIAGRAVKKYSLKELLEIRDKIEARVATAKRKAVGKGPRKVLAEFVQG